MMYSESIMPSDDPTVEVTTPQNSGRESTRRRNKKSSSANESPEVMAICKKCLMVAKYIPHGLDAFCDMDEVFKVCTLISRIAENPDNEALEAITEKILGKFDERTREQYQRTFDYVTVLIPELLTLVAVGDAAKGVELDTHLKEASFHFVSILHAALALMQMQAQIAHIRAEDGSRLCKVVSSYAAPNPDKEHIQPPVNVSTKGGQALMGFMHAQLGRMLCPVKHLKDYIKDPAVTKKHFEDPADPMKVTASVWPAYLYPGEIPRSEYDPQDISNGLFRGYLVERMLKHIFTSPSSALHERAKGAHGGNAKIHKMKTIEPEHIAYAAMLACFILSSAEQWSDQDNLFNYMEYYYCIVHLIRETRDRSWADSLTRHYNEKIFGNPHGLVSISAAVMVEGGDDDLLEMECQFERREAGDIEFSFPSRSPTPVLNDFEDFPDRPLAPSASDPDVDEEDSAGTNKQSHAGATVATHERFSMSSSSLTMVERSTASPRPGPSTTQKRKQLAQDLFEDDTPLMEEDDEAPVVKKKRGRMGSKSAPAKAKTRRAAAKA